MADQPIVLRTLLRHRHWQKYATFCNQYDKAARDIDAGLVGSWPSRAQLHRWLSGELKGLPYPDHCRVLEQMFPGWSAAELFGSDEDANRALPVQAMTPDAARPTYNAVDIRPLVERAFEQADVSIDFSGFSGQTLHGAVQEPLDRIRIGALRPKRLAIRILLPDTRAPMALPCRVDDLADCPPFRARAQGITNRHAQAILDSVQELQALGFIEDATAEVRVHRCAPLFKLYVLNGVEALFGFYPIREQTLVLDGQPTAIYDLMGKEAELFRHGGGEQEDPVSAAYVAQSRRWFEQMWATIARPLTS